MPDNTACSAAPSSLTVDNDRYGITSPTRSRTKSLGDMSPSETALKNRLRRRSGFSVRSLDLNPRDIYNTFSRTLSRTHDSICRSRFVHVLYIVLLILYTFIGASLFQALDGQFHDQVIDQYNQRCAPLISQNVHNWATNCTTLNVTVCVSEAMQQVADCFKDWHTKHQRPTLPMSDYYNALVYAFSVYTTVGYGNVACESESCKYATIVYAIVGIPLFFAFLSDISAVLSQCFIRVWSCCGSKEGSENDSNPLCCFLEPLAMGLTNQHKKSSASRSRGPMSSNNHLELPIRITIENSDMLMQPTSKKSRVLISPHPEHSDYDMQSETTSVYPPIGGQQQFVRNNMAFFRPGSSVNAMTRRVFCAAVLCFVFYLLVVSALLCVMEDWTMFTAFYFLFSSVALIGFGDVFPEDPKIVLVNCAFIVTGIALFGMCYFILQEEIRNKAYQASTHAGRRLSKYRTATQKWLRPSSSASAQSVVGMRRSTVRRRRSAPVIANRSLLSVGSPVRTNGLTIPNSHR